MLHRSNHTSPLSLFLGKCQIVALLLFGALSGQMSAQETRPPNIVLIISDQHKLDATGVYGSTNAITPNIDQLAETGVRFNHCYTPAPVCAPARAAMITGMEPYANGAIYHKAPVAMPNGRIRHLGSGILRETSYHEGIITMAEALKSGGYLTAAPGKMHVHGELQHGVDENHPEGNYMGFDQISVRYYTNFPGGHYEDEVGMDTYQRYRQFKDYRDVYPKGSMHLNQEYLPTLVENDEDNFDMVVARKAVEFIEESAEEETPFFLYVGFEKPHAPFTTTQTYLDMHNPSDFQLPDSYDAWYGRGKFPWVPNWVHSGIPREEENAQNVMAAYHACVTEMDDMVGRVVQALKDQGVYENTLIIYTTDHGEHLFEHGLRGKHCMYDDAVNVPFIISFPRLFERNTVNNSLVSLIDIYPTLCELAGVEQPDHLQGVSLVETLTSGIDIEDRYIFSEFRGADYQLLPQIKDVPSRMIRQGNFKFVYTHGIIHQLYDLEQDPDELHNLILEEGYEDIIQDLFFLTMADWRFQEYRPINASIIKRNSILKWESFDHAIRYSIYFSPENDQYQAEMIADHIEGNTFEVENEGFYWVLAHPEYSLPSPYMGDTPVAFDQYTFQLPISDPVQLD